MLTRWLAQFAALLTLQQQLESRPHGQSPRLNEAENRGTDGGNAQASLRITWCKAFGRSVAWSVIPPLTGEHNLQTKSIPSFWILSSENRHIEFGISTFPGWDIRKTSNHITNYWCMLQGKRIRDRSIFFSEIFSRHFLARYCVRYS